MLAERVVKLITQCIISSDLLPTFEVIDSNTRSKGTLKMKNFNRKNRVGIESSYLGVKLFNQLPVELTGITNLNKFKRNLKKYLLSVIDLLISDDQLNSRNIRQDTM